MAKVVNFYGSDNYGHVGALIGETSGHVYRIRYDSEPLLRMMRSGESNQALQKTMKDQMAKMKPGPERDQLQKQMATLAAPQSFESQETYSNIVVGHPIESARFDTTLPKGMQAMEMPAAPNEQPPVPIGSSAPDFTVADMNGRKVTLSSLRGQVVLLDFWATWCGPCKVALPETARLARLGAGKGLRVLAISPEDQATVAAFQKKTNLAFPAFLDPGGSASTSYHVDLLPTTVVIDPKGILVAYLIGLRDPTEIHAALRKAGFPISN